MICVYDVWLFSGPPRRFRAFIIKYQSWLLYESTIGFLCNLLSDQHEGRKSRETWFFSVIFVILPLLQLFWRPFIADIGSCCICVSWLGDKIFWCKVLRTQFCTKYLMVSSWRCLLELQSSTVHKVQVFFLWEEMSAFALLNCNSWKKTYFNSWPSIKLAISRSVREMSTVGAPHSPQILEKVLVSWSPARELKL